MPEADLLLKNAHVITMNPSRPIADFVAIKANRILEAGSNTDIESFIGPSTRIKDCHGKTVVPGFIDAHCHIFSFLRKLISVDLSPEAVKNIDDIKLAIKKRVEATPVGEWINATGYSDFYLTEKRHPTRQDIDEVAPDHPVVLCHKSLHACVLNSRALDLAGITRESEEPPGGTIERNLETGEPNGILLDMLGYIREEVMPGMTEAENERGIRLVNDHFLKLGITSVQDATVVNDLKRWNKFRWFKENNLLKSRVYYMAGYENLPQFIEAGMRFLYGDEHLRLGGVKITPSENDESAIFPPQPELNQMVLDIHQKGFQAAIHGVLCETVEAATTAIEFALREQPTANRRHRIEHCSECPDHLLKRMKAAGIHIASQPPFVYYNGERYLATVKKERQAWLYRFRSMMNAGLTVAGSADSPIVNDDPLMGIHCAVNRLAETGQELSPEERVSPLEALAMYTTNAARVAFEEDSKGSIESGKLADLVVLSDDPLTVPHERLREIKVEMTALDGQIVRDE